MNNCKLCNKITYNTKFCSKSCAATYNNQGNRRHGKPKATCLICGSITRTSTNKYCGSKCSGISRLTSKSHKNKMNAARQSKYRAQKLRVIANDADFNKIKEIYRNCPTGFEVDHILPVSKGGLHHEDNLQYLTISDNRAKGNKII